MGKSAAYIVKGMTCASCSARIESGLGKHSGIFSAVVNFATSTANVTFDPSQLSAAEIEALITDLGYPATEQKKGGGKSSMNAARDALERKDELQELKRRFLFALACTIPMFVLMILIDRVHCVKVTMMDNKINKASLGQFIMLGLSSPVVLAFGRPFFVRAWQAAKHRSASMDTLVAVGVGSAYGFSSIVLILELANVTESVMYFDAAAALLTFMILGKYLEARAKKGTSGALLQLMSLAPSNAIRVNADGSEQEVPTDEIQIDDRIRVPSGCRVPVDGDIEKGSASVDEQLITGESVPVDKTIGDKAIAGTLCLNADLIIKATSVGDETMLSRILKVVQEAQTTKPAVQRQADRIASVFVPIIITYAMVVFAVWMIASYTNVYPAAWRKGDSEFIFSFEFFLSSMVVACPCALGLATPTAVMVGTGIAASHGILIKDGPTLEQARNVNTVLFDKTGTLTTGHLSVADCMVFTNSKDEDVVGLSATEIKSIVGSVESRSNHPVAQAITASLGTMEQQDDLVVETKAGSGVVGKVTFRKNKRKITLEIHVGKPGFIEEECGISKESKDDIRRLQQGGNTVIVAAFNRTVALIAGLSDSPKDTAAAAVKALHSRNIAVYMVSGDQPLAAKAIAQRVGIPQSHVHAEVLPWEKAEVVRSHQEDPKKIVCFVGDGLNDSPALTQANVGVALGAGTEVAIDAADAVLVKNSLEDLITFLDLSGATIRRVYFNFGWALVYNMISLPLASGLLFVLWQQQLPPVVAGIMMVCSSLSVLGSSLALKLYKAPKLEHVGNNVSNQGATPSDDQSAFIA